MKTIQTKPDTTLGFMKAPEGYENPSMIVPTGSRWGVKEIGKLSEITEEQARELAPEIENNNGDRVTPVESLQSLAYSVGIKEEDFDKYLVVKL